MRFQLYEAMDKRDGSTLYWLHDTHQKRVATFCLKWAASRIKYNSLARPDSITWTEETALAVHAELPSAKHIDSWGV